MTSSKQRAQLRRHIWQVANEVRGAVDGSDFKQLNEELKTTVTKLTRDVLISMLSLMKFKEMPHYDIGK